MPEPRLTVVLVTFNERERVRELLDALAGFTRSAHELVVVDNASTDGTRELLRARAGRPGLVLVENEENLCCARATNQALALVRTEYVVYLCASHALVTAPGWDEALLGSMDARPDLLLAGDVWNPYGFLHASRRYRAGWTPEGHGRERLRHVQGGAWIARRALFEALGGFAADEYPHGGMDVELSYRLLSHGHELGHLPAISCPPAPGAPREGALVVHPAPDDVRARVRQRLASLGGDGGEGRVEVRAASRATPAPAASTPRLPVVVFCERLDNESFCAAVVRELGERYEVRPCGPGWPQERLEQVDAAGARFYLELDAASGSFVRPVGLERLDLPKFAWLVDTHKKPDFHRQLARGMDLTFFAMRGWGHVFEGPTAWLPLHADGAVFRPVERERDVDVCFVGSHAWRAEPLERLAARHGLRLHVSCTTGPREKTRTAEVYARSKVVFNRHVTNDLNFRVFEALACGRALLTDAQHNGQYELFEDGRHYALYKDEPDLERQLLRLLSDDGLRARLEREGAALARAHHTTRARVAQLVRGIETALGAASPTLPPVAATPAISVLGTPSSPVPSEVAPAEPAAPRGPARRWLVIAGDAGPSADSRSYAERLAWRLVEAGHEATIVRQQATPALSPRPAGTGEPTVVEVAPGDLPRPRTEENQLLVAAGPLHRQVDRVAREHGPFDLVLAEGALGQLVGPPLAQRLGRPLMVALTRCEVARRRDRLTRDQVYAAQLEQWACERAAAVVIADPALSEPLVRHYKVKAPRVAFAPPRLRDDAAGARRLLGRLGVAGPYTLVVGHDVVDVDSGVLLRARPGRAVVLAGQDVDLVAPAGRRPLSRVPLSGLALAALARGAEVVLGVGALELPALDARALAPTFAHARDATPDALGQALAAGPATPPSKIADPGRVLAALGEELLRAAATAKPAQEARAHVLR